MDEKRTGPLLSDEVFFTECLNLDYPGMESVKEAVEKDAEGGTDQKSYKEARKEMASYIRRALDAQRFFEIPYEIPENCYKLPGESDAQACERICHHTMVSVGVPCEFGKENPIDWEANPTFNEYKEWTWQLSRHNDIKLLAHEYNETKDERLAQTAADLFQSWVRQAVRPDEAYPGYQTKCWRTIECGIRMGANWPYILFSFYKSPSFTDDILIDWYKSVWEHGERLSKNHMTGNWLIMEMNGLGQIGIFYPQFKKSAQWLRQAMESLEEELDRQVYPDGFQYELTTNYHDVVINNYQRFIEAAQKFDIEIPASLLEKLSSACELDIKLMMPDGTTPDLNDGCRRNVKKTYEIRRRILPQDLRARWITQGDKAGTPTYTSTALAWSGFAVMRTGWKPQDAWALFDAGPYGKAHQHEDKLSVLLYANEKLLLTEGGNYAYDESEMRRYVLSTRSHNTVRMDGQDQNRGKAYTWKEEDIQKKSGLTWNFSNQWDYAKGIYDEGYGKEAGAGPIHERKVFFYRSCTEPLLIVVDRLSDQESGKIHEWEILWHVDSAVKEQTSAKVSFFDADVAWSAGKTEIIIGQEEPEWQGFVPTGTVQGMYRTIPCLTVKVKGNHIRVITVIAPYSSAIAPYSSADQKGRLVRAEASTDYEDEKIVLTFTDGTVRTLFESELEQAR